MDNKGEASRESRIVQLESRRIILEVQRAFVTHSLNSPKTETRVRRALTHRRDDLTRQLAQIDASLRLLREENTSD